MEKEILEVMKEKPDNDASRVRDLSIAAVLALSYLFLKK